MALWYVALFVVVLQAVLLSLVRKYINDKSMIFASIAIFAFAGFLYAVNLDDAHTTLYDSFKNSKIAAWLSVAFVGVAILFQFANPGNTLVYLLRTWNKYTHNLLLGMILLLFVVSTVLKENI
jgi:hypothetical protein